jgi:dTDP-4-amino-4,6-dideoxygalactose transaminase
MEKPIFTGLSPNVEGDDIFLALRLLFLPWKWRNGEAVPRIEEYFRRRFKASHAYVFASGRGALFAILSALGITAGDEVMLQAFTCVAVPGPILWRGATPVFVDIDPETLNIAPEDLEKKITVRTRAVIIQHTFGVPADMEKILAIARAHNLFIIEDCAHAIGSTINGKEIGTFADAAFFSFGRDKAVSSVFGGIAVFHHGILGEKAHRIYESLALPPHWWILKQLIHPPLTAFIRSTHCKCAGRIGKIFLYLAMRLRIITKAVSRGERRGRKPRFLLGRMPNALAHLALHQLGKLEWFNNNRRRVVERYRKELIIPAQKESRGSTAIFLRYTLFREDAKQLIASAKKYDIFLGDWYRPAVAPAGVDYRAISYKPELYPVAERAARMAINLPTDVHIGDSQIDRIVTFFKKIETVEK